MATFIGDYISKLDSKSRAVLPSAFKKQMEFSEEDSFIVKKDIFENCLVLYPQSEWERQIEIIKKNTNPYNKDHNRFVREFFRGTAEITLDSNNRILLPKRLTEVVGIKKEIYMAGQDSKIEIWAKELYEESTIDNKELAELAEKVMVNPVL